MATIDPNSDAGFASFVNKYDNRNCTFSNRLTKAVVFNILLAAVLWKLVAKTDSRICAVDCFSIAARYESAEARLSMEKVEEKEEQEEEIIETVV